MRHIKKSDLRCRIREDWINAAREAFEKLRRLPRSKRSEFISNFFQDKTDLWAELKRCLAQPTPAKCWYSEVQRPLSDLEIDHFRPKNAVAKTKHAGYWWLAFTWENFRIASSLANKRRKDDRTQDIQGKGTFFPLLDESKRVSDKQPAATKRESPVLLDPFEAKDVILLDYSPEDGKVVEKFDESKNKVMHLRAKKSIELYHLNEGMLIARRGELSAALSEKGDRIEELFTRREAGKRLSHKEEKELQRLQNEVAGFINATAEFSAFCRACLRQRGSRGWNEELLLVA